MISRLLCGLAGVLLAAHVVQAEVDYDFRRVHVPHTVVKGISEENYYSQNGTVPGKISTKVVPVFVVIRPTGPNSLAITWFLEGKNHAPSGIHWTRRPDSPTGELIASGWFPLSQGLWGGFHAITRLQRTEDGQGVMLDENHFLVSREAPDWKRMALPHLKVVIRPHKITIQQTCQISRDSSLALRQKLTVEVDY